MRHWLSGRTLRPNGFAADDGGLDAAALTALPLAVRSRVLHGAAVTAGCPAGALTACHIRQLDELLTGWRGQRWIDLPVGVRALRRYGKLLFTKDSEAATGGSAVGPAVGPAVGTPVGTAPKS